MHSIPLREKKRIRIKYVTRKKKRERGNRQRKPRLSARRFKSRPKWQMMKYQTQTTLGKGNAGIPIGQKISLRVGNPSDSC